MLTDRPSRGARGPDTASVALWQAHVTRAVNSVRRLRIGVPRPGLARRDPRALRAALVVALVAAFAIAGDDAPSRLAQAMEPTLPREIPSPATELQAWITPPAYTRLAPIFLKPDSGSVSVPAGARLTVSVTGGSVAPTLMLDGHSEPFRALDKASFQADRDLHEGGHLTVRRDSRELAAWDLAVVADQPPTADWTDGPGRAIGSLSIWAMGATTVRSHRGRTRASPSYSFPRHAQYDHHLALEPENSGTRLHLETRASTWTRRWEGRLSRASVMVGRRPWNAWRRPSTQARRSEDAPWENGSRKNGLPSTPVPITRRSRPCFPARCFGLVTPAGRWRGSQVFVRGGSIRAA